MAGNIFINYRREDDAGFTQALYSRLEQAFPSESLFMDVDNIAPGLDFVQVLNDEVARCDVVIAVIGKNWLSVTDETGGRRLDNPEDFVRIEIESALSQKKRVIPVLVNDARMPRSTELPETMRAFARCNAARLTHERFRADMAGLIKSLEQILAQVEAARQADDEAARSEAKEREDAKRLRREKRDQPRKARETKVDARPAEPGPREPSSGLVRWIAGLPSEVSGKIPIALVAVVLLGSIVPTVVFVSTSQDGVGWGPVALVYGLVGLVAIGVVFRMRRNVMGGAELALYWLATVYFLGRAATALASIIWGQPTSFLPLAIVALAVAAALVVLRRNEIGSLEFAVYWFGLTLFIYAAGISLVASLAQAAELRTDLYHAAVTLLSTAIVSGLAILAWRNRRLSKPELAVYLLGIAYWLFVGVRFMQV